eukprot:Tamp_04063.p1 GENE.Tamp_04063~~Tamp_04063.p1  ORF type:complete len:220 (-),score=25.88 Tamp_04063:2278-2937(-)
MRNATQRLQPLLQDAAAGAHTLRWGQPLRDLNAQYISCQMQVQDALRDDIDTAAALRHLRQLVAAVQRVQHEEVAAGQPPSPAAWPLISNVCCYVRHTLETWGVDCRDWLAPGDAVETERGAAKVQPDAGEVIELLLHVRQQVRQLAVERVKAPGGKHEPLVGDLLALSDKIRDSALPSLGVVVQDAKAAGGAGAGRQSPLRWRFEPSLLRDAGKSHGE